MGTLLIANIIIAVISIVIWYFLNRASVRANRIVELLELIDRKNTKQIDLLADMLESSSKSLKESRENGTVVDYFEKAKLIGEALTWADGKLNKDNVIKFSALGNSYIEREKDRGEDVDNSIDLFTILKNEMFSKLSSSNREIADKIYKERINFI